MASVPHTKFPTDTILINIFLEEERGFLKCFVLILLYFLKLLLLLWPLSYKFRSQKSNAIIFPNKVSLITLQMAFPNNK